MLGYVSGLSVERYGAFAAPPKHRESAKNRACIGNLIIWLLGIACGFPLAVFAFEESYYKSLEDKRKTIVSSSLKV